MTLKYALLADATIMSVEGKLSIIGIFREIRAKAIPFAYSRITLVMGLEFGGEDLGQKRNLTVNLIDLDGKTVRTSEGVFDIQSPDMKGANIVLDFENVHFANLGIYRFDITVDGRPVEAVALEVIQAGGEHGR